MTEHNTNSPPPNYSLTNRATHSFSHLPSIPQVFAYLVISFDIITFYLCIHYINENWIIFGFYSFSLFLVIVSTALTSCSDPTDRTVYKYKWSKYKK